jgi:threonine dehydrogenase-like Zn-dependent dehydrogenase
MKALELESYNKLVYKDVEDPVINQDEVLVRVRACGICGSDIHGLDGSTGRRRPPLIMGHEAAGEVASTGSKVSGWKVGDRVTFDSTIYRLDDWYTLEGRYNLSNNRKVLGVSSEDFRRQGAFAEYVSIPQHILYKIPDKVSFEEAAMVEPVAVALHAIGRSKVQIGECCVVVGAGMIGIFLVKLLRKAGLGNLFVVDINSKKREQAIESGADMSFDPSDKELLNEIHKRTHNRGADLSFEVVGLTDSLTTAISVLRKGGRAILVGNLSGEVTFPLQKVVTNEIDIYSSCAIRGEYETVLTLIEKGIIDVKDQISSVAPLSEGPKWFEALRTKDSGLNKVILVP